MDILFHILVTWIVLSIPTSFIAAQLIAMSSAAYEPVNVIHLNKPTYPDAA